MMLLLLLINSPPICHCSQFNFMSVVFKQKSKRLEPHASLSTPTTPEIHCGRTEQRVLGKCGNVQMFPSKFKQESTVLGGRGWKALLETWSWTTSERHHRKPLSTPTSSFRIKTFQSIAFGGWRYLLGRFILCFILYWAWDWVTPPD